MKLRSTLLTSLLCATMANLLFAQTPDLGNPWGDLEFHEDFIQKSNIRSIRVRQYTSRPSARAALKQGVDMDFDSKGRLVSRASLGQSGTDTSSTETLHYHGNEVLGWTEVQDHQFDRTFRTGYRFTADHDLYQEKSYEILPNDNRLLLQSKQYVYADGDENLLRAIRTLENNQVVEVHSFDYDHSGKVVAEIVEDSRGELIKTTRYEYDQENRIAVVSIEELGQVTSRYLYSYNNAGQPTRIEWFQGNTLKGIALYEYDERGRVSHLSRTQNPETRAQETTYAVYEYRTWDELEYNDAAQIVATN